MKSRDDKSPPPQLEYLHPEDDTAPAPEELFGRVCVAGAEFLIAAMFCGGAALCIAMRPLNPVSWFLGLVAGSIGLFFAAVGLQELRDLMRRFSQRRNH